MNENPIRIKIFIGYQIDSSFHEPDDFHKMGKNLESYLQKQQPKVQVEIEHGEFAAGAQLWNETSEKITLADLSVFDISENNPNVLLEVGIALGQGKPLVLLKEKSSIKEFPTPSDLTAFAYIPYTSHLQLPQPPVINKIAMSIYRFLNLSHDPCFYFKSLWGLLPTSKTIVVCSELPSARNPVEFEDYVHIRRHGDLDALFLTIQTINRLYPKMDLAVSRAKRLNELPNDWEASNLILIGGPDFNPIVNDFEHLCPVEYGYGPGENDVYLIRKNTNEELHPRFICEKNRDMAIDYGFFLKRKLRKGGKSKLIIIGGAHTWGVFGGIRMFGCTSFTKRSEGYRNSKFVVTNLGSDPSFLYLFKVRGTVEGIHTPLLEIDKVEVIKE